MYDMQFVIGRFEWLIYYKYLNIMANSESTPLNDGDTDSGVTCNAAEGLHAFKKLFKCD